MSCAICLLQLYDLNIYFNLFTINKYIHKIYIIIKYDSIMNNILVNI